MSDLAEALGRTPKAIRNAVSRGTIPKPRKVAGRSCWLREEVVRFVAESPRRFGKAEASEVKITAKARKDRPGTVQVMFELPTVNGRRNRPRRTAPAGMNEAQAVAWGHSILKDVLREHMLGNVVEQKEETNEPKTEAPQVSNSTTMTVSEFWDQHMIHGYFRRLAPGTCLSYQGKFNQYIRPTIGGIPLDRVGREHIRTLRRAVQKMPKRGSRNGVLGLARTTFAYAVRLDVIDIDDVPTIHSDEDGEEPEETPRYSAEEVDRMVAEAPNFGTDTLVALLLMLDTILRVSEVCALTWADVDLERATITVRRNISGGKLHRPKHQKKNAKNKSVGLSPRLIAALRALPKKGELVLVHPSGSMHTRSTIQTLMKRVQRVADTPIWSPHKFKHTGASLLGDQNAPLTLIQGQARHAHPSTTLKYIHVDHDTHAEKAAAFWHPWTPRGHRRPPTRRRAPTGPSSRGSRNRDKFETSFRDDREIALSRIRVPALIWTGR